jgi:hypothetical protein
MYQAGQISDLPTPQRARPEGRSTLSTNCCLWKVSYVQYGYYSTCGYILYERPYNGPGAYRLSRPGDGGSRHVTSNPTFAELCKLAAVDETITEHASLSYVSEYRP